MRLVLVSAIAAFAIISAQAAPQFDNYQSRGWRSNDYSPHDGRRESYRYPELYGSLQPPVQYPQFQPQNYDSLSNGDRQGSPNQCWDPAGQVYRLNNQPPSQSYNNEFHSRDNRSPQRGLNPYFAEPYLPPSRQNWNGIHGPSPPPPPPHHHEHGHGHGHGHGRERPPPHHGHGRPPPPPHHGHGGPPPPPPPHHGHGHGPPPPPPEYGYGHGGAPPPPPPPPGYGYGHGIPPPGRRPPHNPQNVGDNELEICKDIPNESTTPNPVGPEVTSSQEQPLNIPTSYPGLQIPDTTAKQEDRTEQTTTHGSVKATTEFDWNNFALGASVDNTGGAGVIDVRMGEFPSETTTAPS